MGLGLLPARWRGTGGLDHVAEGGVSDKGCCVSWTIGRD